MAELALIAVAVAFVSSFGYVVIASE